MIFHWQGNRNPFIDHPEWVQSIWRSADTVTAPRRSLHGDIDGFRIAHVQRSDGWIETTWNNMINPGAFAAAGPEEQEGGEPPPVAGAGVVVCLMG